MLNRLRNRIYGPDSGDRPVSFDTVFEHERKVIAASRAWRDCDSATPDAPAGPTSPPEVPAAAPEEAEDLVGLAFSGGGIRSATFNLGLIQALADLRLLRAFDYLSTVSGGSFIGSWLSALIHRENHREDRKPDEDEPRGICRVEQRLRTGSKRQPNERQAGPDPSHEDPAVTFLRRYSNYLTPKVGLFSADTWAVISIYLRNLILNLTILASGLAVVLLVPRLVVAVTRYAGAWEPEHAPHLVFWAALAATLLLGTGAVVRLGSSFASLMTREKARAKGEPGTRQSAILWQVAAPLTAAAFLLSRWLPAVASLGSWGDWAFWVALTYGGGWLLALVAAWFDARRARVAPQNLKTWLGLVLTAVLAGLVTGPLLPAVGAFLKDLAMHDAWGALVCGPPLILLWLLLLGLLQTGLMGRSHPDHQREWLSRFGGWLLIFAAVWALWLAMIVHAPVVLSALEGWLGGAVFSGWLAATISGLLAARSRPVRKGPSIIQSLVLAVAPYVFVGGLLAALAVGLDWGVSRISDEDAWAEFAGQRQALLETRRIEDEIYRANEIAGRPNVEQSRSFWNSLYQLHSELLDKTSRDPVLILALVVGLLAATLVLSWRIDVNEFSMHGFYRNRLARCYLGASVDAEERHRGKQPFTGFHESDDLELGALFPKGVEDRQLRGKPAPIHLINTSLNLVTGEELAWRDRKAAPFILSPLYCGFDTSQESFRLETDSAILEHGYRRTAEGGRNYGSSPVPLTLGGAVAISGAAASPNMGFRSTPALAFLLTVFNIRVGWWLGNPRHRRAWMRSGPSLGIMHLFMELFGRTRGRTRYVYLSDGEHFENLGIYELVRRRCRFILATDAGADPEYAFDNLGNAIRKCRTDLGVEIEIDADPIHSHGEAGFANRHCAVGKIHYPPGGGTELGTLLYVKSSLTGDEPADVLAYARATPPFPHQTTADQFFDESQFESYRRLGYHVAMEVLMDSAEVATETVAAVDTESASRSQREKKVLKLEKLLLDLDRRWHPPGNTDTGEGFRKT